MIRNLLILLALAFIPAQNANAQKQPALRFTLSRSIEIATDSSLQAFISKNMYRSSYWSYRSFRAGRLPSLYLQTTPLQYRSDFTRRYDSENNIDVYRQQQSLYSYGNVSVRQNLDLTGGTFYIDSELGYMRNFGDNNYSQFTSVPVRIGYSQSLFGFNGFKWDRKIEPLKFKKAQIQYMYAREEISETTIQYFFNLAMAQLEFQMAQENVVSSDTLYFIGRERHKIASISKAELTTLKLNTVNARNALQNADISLKRAHFSFVSFLNMDKDTEVEILMPGKPMEMEISPDFALQQARENNPDFVSIQQSLLEAERAVEQTTKSSNFDANLSMSVGFNQVAPNFSGVYTTPPRQDVVSISFGIPLVDWGVRKGRANMARNNLNVTKISLQQTEQKLEQDVIMTVSDFNMQRNMIGSAEEALDLAIQAYDQTQARFISGDSDLNSLILSLERRNSANRGYLSALRSYWQSYYKLRKLTLFDFLTKEVLTSQFDKIMEMNE
ncbi:MAG: TolC family protein [Prevotellaceae bacterium]|jgi:outer membrane protein TolC|nr:TolC family protein [Prevotellaceae bacterium]